MFDEILGPKKKKVNGKRVAKVNLLGDMVPRVKYEAAMGQLADLTKFLLDEFPGSMDLKKTPVKTAIRLLKSYKDL